MLFRGEDFGVDNVAKVLVFGHEEMRFRFFGTAVDVVAVVNHSFKARGQPGREGGAGGCAV